MTTGGRRRAATLVILLLTGSFTWGCGAAGDTPPATTVTTETGPAATATAGSPPAQPLSLQPGQPTLIEIPAIKVQAPITTVGLAADGTVQVPPLDRANETGWYEHGPSPGELGPAVILGHVDGNRRPAVFFHLADLKPGDRITVHRADGRSAVFATRSVERVPKTQFPTERVYGNVDRPELRLVTCGGSFDSHRRSYTDNVIVFAELVATT
jgi:sortase (surface protein transpeptidase)